MKARRIWRPIPLLVLATAAIGFAFGAQATTSKAPPICKAGEKSTSLHPCVKAPKCKPDQKSTRAHPCTRPHAAGTPIPKPSSGTGSGGGSTGTQPTTTTGGSTGSVQVNGCLAGQVIPQGAYAGDGDEDNTNGGDPEDGDGCL